MRPLHQQRVCMQGISSCIAQALAMNLFCYKAAILAAKEIVNRKMQKAALVAAGNSSGSRKAYEAPVKVPSFQCEGEGADGLTLRRAGKGNQHRNGRKKLGLKGENLLDPLKSLIAIDKEKCWSLVSVTLPHPEHTAPAVVTPTGYKRTHTATSKETSADHTPGKEIEYAELLRDSYSQTFFPRMSALNALPIVPMLICKAVKTVARFERWSAEQML